MARAAEGSYDQAEVCPQNRAVITLGSLPVSADVVDPIILRIPSFSRSEKT